jgi:hypothetical protein
MFKKGQVKASEAEIDRAQGGYLSTSALLEAQQNITNIYGKVSQILLSFLFQKNQNPYLLF